MQGHFLQPATAVENTVKAMQEVYELGMTLSKLKTLSLLPCLVWTFEQNRQL